MPKRNRKSRKVLRVISAVEALKMYEGAADLAAFGHHDAMQSGGFESSFDGAASAMEEKGIRWVYLPNI